MIKQLSKVGNSTALLLDKPILKLMGMTEGDMVQLTLSNGSLVISPVHPRIIKDEQFQEALDQVVKKRRRLLARLAP